MFGVSYEWKMYGEKFLSEVYTIYSSSEYKLLVLGLVQLIGFTLRQLD